MQPTFTITPNPVSDGNVAVFKGTGCLARPGDPTGFVPTVYLGVAQTDLGTPASPLGAAIRAAESDNGDAPVLTPDANGNWSYDLEVPTGTPSFEVTFTAVCDGYNWSYDYRPVSLTIDGEPIEPILLLPDFDGPWDSSSVPTLIVGQSYEILAGLFTPGEKVTLTLHSDPLLVSTFTADGDGIVDGVFVLPAGASAGAHELVVTGVESGVSASASIMVAASAATPTATVTATVTATPVRTTATTTPTGPQLAATGTPTGSMSLVGFVLLALGGAGVMFGRRRPSRQH